MMLKKIYVMFAFMILIGVSVTLALNVDVGCPTNVAFQAGATVECLVKNPDPALGVNLMSLTVDSVSGGASFVKVETLAGSQKLFESDPNKKGFIGTADKTANVFKITLKTNSATETIVNLKDVVVKTGDGTQYGGAGGGSIIIVNNKVTFASGPVACTANDWDISWGSCSATCGGGIQTSTITKKATSASCTGETGKPAVTQSCNAQACPLFVCTGTIPSNAALCSGDDQGLTVNTAITLVATCGANKCEYTCNSGSELKGGACVSICTPSCTGKTCGSDGCGGSCGNCAAGLTCQADGTCAAAVDNKIDAGSPEKKTLLQNILNAINDNNKETLQKISAIASALKAYFG